MHIVKENLIEFYYCSIVIEDFFINSLQLYEATMRRLVAETMTNNR